MITKTGSVHLLDPKTIADAPASELDTSTFSDTRVVRAPLPAVESGAVIEFEVTTDSGPAFPDAGITRRIQIFDNVPRERFHLSIDGVNSATLQIIYRQIPETAVRKSTSKGVTHLEVELGPFEPRTNFDGNLPPNVSRFPYLAFSTAPSWQALAARYADVVEQQIQAADVKGL